MRFLDDAIAQFGWGVQGVFDPEGEKPHYAYTVGLAAKGLPELLVFSLPSPVMFDFLNNLAVRYVTQGLPPLDTDLHDIAQGLPARLLPIPRPVADQYMQQALHRFPDYSAVQLVWPDECARFPWDANYSIPADVQPILRNLIQ
jgi:hypothetical protein